MKYLILGGAGFIGTHLSKQLIEDGHSVTVVDSLETSSMPVNNVKFIWGDIRNMDIGAFIKQCDVVYHLAGSVGVSHIDKNPQQTLFNNVELMNTLIPLFEKYQKKVIFASTSEIYGEGPFSENDNASIGPSSILRWGYAASKLLTEFMITASTFPYVIVRFFNVTGPGQSGNYGMVLPTFIERAQHNLPLPVYGDGNQVRSFCHIIDAITSLQIVEHTNREVYNIGNETPISVSELANRVITLTDSTSEIKLIPYEEKFSEHYGDIHWRVPDLTKIRDIGYSPTLGLDDIIRDML